MFALVLSFCSFRARARVTQIWGTGRRFQWPLQGFLEASRLAATFFRNFALHARSNRPTGPWLEGCAASQPLRSLRGRVRMWSSGGSGALLVRGISRPVRSDPRFGLLLPPLSQRVARDRQRPPSMSAGGGEFAYFGHDLNRLDRLVAELDFEANGHAVSLFQRPLQVHQHHVI